MKQAWRRRHCLPFPVLPFPPLCSTGGYDGKNQYFIDNSSRFEEHPDIPYVVDGKVIINEYAPRVHNTGHHTLTGSSISQFEEHILAVAGMNIVRWFHNDKRSSYRLLSLQLL